ncbi:sensor histidine kinase [Azospirillum picis]|uniref:histidine kinase n=1 Tax=Azospirillum picis TaxID=488438 RepID=A0ABU0MDG1_9PROT|nr:sensor histidine kinase [Azospirillum picis]MBP2297512.1 two-component sensor histidine kinase [Azospirillum picis]MDQ0531465.1 two-component sensor histidine kinase [Azospirillum picis]
MPMLQRFQAAHSPPDQPGDAVASSGVSGDSPESRLTARIQELESELRELQHRAKNSLQLVISLLKLQAGRIRDPDARAAYEQTMVRIEALAILYRQLHESGAGTHVDLGRYISALCEAVREGTPGALSRVPVSVDSDPIQIGLYEAMPLGLIIAELVTNSLHHAFPEDGWIRVSVRQQAEDNRARLTVEDNGRALPAGFDATAEDGLMLAEALAGQLGDTLSTDSDAAGTTASVSFPL